MLSWHVPGEAEENDWLSIVSWSDVLTLVIESEGRMFWRFRKDEKWNRRDIFLKHYPAIYGPG